MKRSILLIAAIAMIAGIACAGPFSRGRSSCPSCASGQCKAPEASVPVLEDPLEAKPAATITADKTTIKAGESVVLTWKSTNAKKAVLATVTESGETATEAVELNGTKTVTPTESTGYRLYVSRGLKRTYAQVAVDVEGETPTPTPAPTPVPDPIEGFTLSAVGIGSAFEVDDQLSAAARDKELGAFLASQNGTWTIITDEVMKSSHPAAFDAWVAELTKSGKAKPAVVWHNQGKVLSIESVAGKTAADLLAMAKSQVPAAADRIVIRGQVRKLGLNPKKPGLKWTGPRVSAILKPLAAADCPSVDLQSQVLYFKDQTGGTCVLNAFAGACESAIYCAYGKTNALELSPYFLANLVDGYNGTWAETAAEAIQKQGNLPFGDVAPHAKLPAGWKRKAAGYKCLAVYGPPESDSPGYIRAALHRGYIVCAGISCGNGFEPDADGYISYERGAGLNVNHEIRVVAWDQAKARFKIANSWGKSWGISGGAWLDEKFFKEDTDLWVVVAMVANPAFKFYAPVTDGK